MEHQIINKTILSILVILSFTLSSCFKDNEEDLYPDGGTCNTENVSFSQTIWPVINNNCVSCHSGAGANAGIRLGSYSEFVEAIDGGRLLGAIKHESGFSAMPQGGAQLNNCSISQIEAWIAQGKLNN
ncbi:MAG: hypothetical protein CVT92_14260 [Bacteroidetes bacterium HGW-Bacteroidetes-1]|jgi:hypothetical protein|nr:MAG: hypothetical protein CVT92_14260 [Bacteroidetes bacterium HGW-Bacteroidetes-1]